MSKEKIGRVAGLDWSNQRANHAIAVYNANYTESGDVTHPHWSWPWSVVTPDDEFRSFRTHAEAIAWAFEKAEALK